MSGRARFISNVKLTMHAFLSSKDRYKVTFFLQKNVSGITSKYQLVVINPLYNTRKVFLNYCKLFANAVIKSSEKEGGMGREWTISHHQRFRY